MNTLRLTDNAKTKFTKGHYNTFGLNYGLPEAGGTCPGATAGKGGCLALKKVGGKLPTCYMAKLVLIRPGVGKVLQRNTDLLKGRSYSEMVDILDLTVKDFVDNYAGNLPFFRLHYSGDFFSEDYAKAWVEVIGRYPNVRFWTYTRSFEYAPLFVGLTNMTLFLSVDEVNYSRGLEIYEKLKDEPNIAMAWLGANAPEAGGVRWVSCPETSGKLKNLPERGACGKCRLCVDNYKIKVKNIKFTLH